MTGKLDKLDSIDVYDDYADLYAAGAARREAAGVDGDPLGILPRLLDLLGDLAGRAALDAGCGEGRLARALAARGARVTGVDISPRLIQLARERDPGGAIDYRVADLCQPLPDLAGRFDVIASCLVLNDVHDHRGFAATLGAALAPGGRLVLALNNPYSYVVRKHVADYFASGAAYPYRGMAAQGLKLHFYHRTLEEYLDAFLAAGLRLTTLTDLSKVVNNAHQAPIDTLLPDGYRFPYFMLLAFAKP
jgi:2-polyprenyl-3-methyl-5-hydroxy-6-metoxy-1,4-benzoquinol methylase